LVTLLVLLVGLEVVTWRWKSRSGSTAAAAPRVVAVLPIDAVGGNPENQVLCRGLTDLLTTRLAQIGSEYGLEVVPASEVRTYAVNSIETARQKLGVTMVVEGSWDFASNQVMYSLVDAQSRRSVNADYVRANLNDIASVERGVADNLLKMVAGHFGADHGTEPNVTEPHPDAYQYYVRGVGYLDEYQKASSLQAAVALFNSALERNPSFAPALAGMGEAYWRLYQETKDASWIPKAVDACNRARSMGDKLSQVHTTLGLIDQGQGKDQDAVQEFKRALEMDATSDSAYRGLAAAYESLGKSAEAEAAYKQAIDIRKNYWGGYSALGAFYAKQAKYDDAVSQFQHVIDLAPENVRGYTNLAAIYLLQGKSQQAEELLRKSLGIEPNYRAYSNLGALLFARKEYGAAAGMYESALKLNDRDARVWGSQADAYYWAGDRPKAAVAYAKAVELQEAAGKTNPADATALSQLALWRSMLGQSARSSTLINQALKHSPNDPEILFRAAEIYDQNGDPAAALAALEKSVHAGYPVNRIEQDPTLENLRDNSRYRQLLHSAPAQTAAE
jgi:serine/threonine-protein kinase